MASEFIPLSIKQIKLINNIIQLLETDLTIGQTNAGYIMLRVGNAYEPYSTVDVSTYLTYIKDSGEYKMDSRELLNGIRDWWISQKSKTKLG